MDWAYVMDSVIACREVAARGTTAERNGGGLRAPPALRLVHGPAVADGGICCEAWVLCYVACAGRWRLCDVVFESC